MFAGMIYIPAEAKALPPEGGIGSCILYLEPPTYPKLECSWLA